MITIKNEHEINYMRQAGRILAETLEELKSLIKPGMPAFLFDQRARELIKAKGGRPSFLDYKPGGARGGFPAAICVSINNEVVHGIPGKKVLKKGDIVSLDLGVEIEGYHTDSAVTVPVGKVPYLTGHLIKVTEEALWAGIKHAADGEKIGDIGATVQSVLEKNHLGVVRELVGHGIGRTVHEDPAIPNYGKMGTGLELKEGMTICIEPMATMGKPRVMLAEDGWTYVTSDGSLSAHFEHTILIKKKGCEVLTSL